MTTENELFMKRALALAKRGKTSPNPMVGAVVVREGRIVGEGFHPKAGDPHAEVFALRAAGDQAEGADLYVTLEPCCHHGKTPPCTEAVIRSKVRRVFAAMEDPNPLVAGKGIAELRGSGIDVNVGIMESAAQELNEAFIKRVTTGLPLVLWKTAMTLDGKIASRTGDARWITGEHARKEVHRLRSRFDAVLTGSGTVIADDPQLTVRGIRGGVNPLRVVADSSASIPLDSRILDASARTIIAVTDKAPSDRLDALRRTEHLVLTLPENEGRVDLRELLLALVREGVNSVLLESGGELAAAMLKNGLVDKGIAFIAPKIIGGRESKTSVEGHGIEHMRDAIDVSSFRVRRFGDDIALEFSFHS
jgi:diaminohydroxyphosphoribosylaminopyrimidine deaminase/5-amino-6-(5-phosphoribosylamino)uracil reductase